MAFKLNKTPYDISGPSVYFEDLGPGILGQTNKNGTIVINSKLHPKFMKEVIKHERVHVDQIERGDLDYDGENIYWKGKKYNKNLNFVARAENTEWEREAYMKSGTKFGDDKYNI